MIGWFVLGIAASAVLVTLGNLPVFLKGVALERRRAHFRCTLCGNCCRFRTTPLTGEDVRRLEGAGYKDFAEASGEPRMRRTNGKCVFLKDDKCTVHDNRPDVCRDFPFFREFGIGYARRATYCPALEELENARKKG